MPKSKNISGSASWLYNEADDSYSPWEGDVSLSVDGNPVSSSNPVPVEVISGGGAGTEYTEGDTDASATGTVMMVKDASNNIAAVKGDRTDGVLVNLGANNDIDFPANEESTGTISTALDSVVHTVTKAASSFLIEISGTYVGELIIQVDAGSGTWNYYKGLNGQDFVSGLGSGQAGFLFGPAAGFSRIRIIPSSWTSGAASVRIKTSVASGTLFMAHPIPTGNNTIGHVYTIRRFYEANTQSFATIGTTSTSVFSVDASITGLYLKNTSLTASISFNWGSTAVLNSGFTLLAGESIFLDDDYVSRTVGLNAIASAAGTNLAYVIHH